MEVSSNIEPKVLTAAFYKDVEAALEENGIRMAGPNNSDISFGTEIAFTYGNSSQGKSYINGVLNTTNLTSEYFGKHITVANIGTPIEGSNVHYIVANSFGGNGPIFTEWRQDLILELVFYESQWLTVGNPMVHQDWEALSTHLFRHTKIFANRTCSVDFYQDAGTNLHFPFKFPLQLRSDIYGPYVTVARDLNNVATDISAETGVYSIAEDEVVVELAYNINSNKRGYIHVEGVCE